MDYKRYKYPLTLSRPSSSHYHHLTYPYSQTMLTTTFACPGVKETVRPATTERPCGCYYDDEDDFSSDASSSSGSDSPAIDPWISDPDEEYDDDEDDTETLVPSGATTAIATPRMRNDEVCPDSLHTHLTLQKLPESAAGVKIATTSSFQDIKEADAENEKKRLIASASHFSYNELRLTFEQLAQAFLEQEEPCNPGPATPVPTPADGTLEIKSDKDFAEASHLSLIASSTHTSQKLTGELKALPITKAKTYAEPDRHLHAFDLIPFPTVDFDTPLVAHPNVKPKLTGKTYGAGRSGFCNSFKSVALRDAAVY